METVRRVMGILMIVMLPPAVLYWFVVHPFVAFWRRLGARLTFLILFPLMILAGYLLYHVRDPILGRDLGTSWWLAGAGLALYLLAIVLDHLCRRHLTFAILAGVPELSAPGSKGRLLQEGIYGVVRHPRYTSITAAMLGWALVINHSGIYLLWLGLVLALLTVIRLEERELTARFGPEYSAYRRRVPMLLPRPWGGKAPERTEP